MIMGQVLNVQECARIMHEFIEACGNNNEFYLPAASHIANALLT